MPNDPQVPWTDEQWARTQPGHSGGSGAEARVAATFLPLFGPLAPDTDFVRAEIIPDDPPLSIEDRDTIQLATLQVKVPVRSVQLADPELRSVLAVFRCAANVLARLEDAVIFRVLRANPSLLRTSNLRQGSPGLPLIWEIRRRTGMGRAAGTARVVHCSPMSVSPRPCPGPATFGDCPR